MRIVTLTLNPAFDIHCAADGFRPYGESIVDIIRRDTGGKGVNISRALLAVGAPSTAVTVVGEENGEEFCRALTAEGLTLRPIYVKGRIRENITLHESERPETRISFGGFSVEGSVLDDVRAAVGEVDSDTVVTFTGSVPEGLDVSRVLDMLRELRDKGAFVVIDSRSVSLDALIEFRPSLIKPNRAEAEKYMRRPLATPEDALLAARELCERGVENVMISLDSEGAVLACPEGCYYATAPRIEALSTIGAGESSIAGFIDGRARGLSSSECLAGAVTFGSAACMTEGTMPPRAEDISALEALVKVRSASEPSQ